MLGHEIEGENQLLELPTGIWKDWFAKRVSSYSFLLYASTTSLQNRQIREASAIHERMREAWERARGACARAVCEPRYSTCSAGYSPTWSVFQYFTMFIISEPRRKNEDTEEAQKRRKQRAKKRKQQMQKKIEENKVNVIKEFRLLQKMFIIPPNLFSILNRLKLWRNCWIEKLQDHGKKKRRYDVEESFMWTQIWSIFYIYH